MTYFAKLKRAGKWYTLSEPFYSVKAALLAAERWRGDWDLVEAVRVVDRNGLVVRMVV